MVLDKFRGIFKRRDKDDTKKKVPKDTGVQEAEKGNRSDAKYPDKTCALCGRDMCDKRWAGQYWHKECYRQMRKMARGMV
jgi:hypothetical protein